MLGFIPIGSVLTFWFGYLLITLFTFKIGSFTYWQPFPKTSFQIQTSGQIKTDVPAKVFILDGMTTNAATVKSLHDAGKKVVCKVSIGTVVKGSDDAAILSDYLGAEVPNHPEQLYVDIRSPTVMKVIESRFDILVSNNCDAADITYADNWNQDTKFAINSDEQLKFNVWLAGKAHDRGMSIGLHNDAEQIRELVDYFDFSVTDECIRMSECEKYLPFVDEGKAVFTIEYTGTKDTICDYANQMDLSAIIKTPQLGSEYTACQ
eukprot:NODE_148_length_15570_cov_0.950100.p8 type:complete len:263 gc:universal NODE_148_length_15570_cov_0.950100:3178-3966(+)